MQNYSGDNDYYPRTNTKFTFSDDSAEYWSGFREEIVKIREKSQDDFEKYLNVFGSGGLLVGLTLLSKLAESSVEYKFQYILIFGCLMFVLCLLSNLISHYIAIFNCDKNMDDIASQSSELWKNFEKRNNILKYINWASLGAIVIGTSFITLFLILNINTMSEKNEKPHEKPQTTKTNPERINEEKGRTIQKPTTERKPKN